MYNVVRSFTPEVFQEAYIGYANGDFYDLGDCRNPIENCGENYMFYTRNTVVFGNDHLWYCAVDASGAMNPSSCVDRGKSFDTVNRPWYLQGQGWGELFISATPAANVSVRAFSMPFRGGVFAAETLLDSQGQCYIGRNINLESTATTTALSPLIFFVGVVLTILWG
jgi:hypothetical protein